MKRLGVMVAALLTLGSCALAGGQGRSVSLLKRGLALAEEKSYEEAIPVFLEAARARDPVPPSVRWAAWNNLGVVLARTKQYRAALTAYGNALHHWRNAPVVRFNRGITYLHQGQLRYAEDDFAQAARKSPVFYAAWNNLGIARLRQGRPAEALVALQRALQGRARSPGAWNNLGAAYLVLGRIAQAKRAFERALQLEPGYVPAWRNLTLLGAAAANRPAPLLVVAAKDGRTLGR